MADTKTTALTAATAATSDDLLYLVDDPGGTPTSKKITVAAFTAKTDPFSLTNATIASEVHIAGVSGAATGSGTATDANDGILIQTTATGSSTYRIAGPNYYSVGYNQDMRVRISIPNIDVSPAGTIRIYAFSDNVDPASAASYAGFRISASAGTDTVLAVSKDGTTEQTTDVTASFLNTTNATVFRILDIVLTSGSNVKFYINGTLIATHSTNIPLASDTTSTVKIYAMKVENATDAANTRMYVQSYVAQIAF